MKACAGECFFETCKGAFVDFWGPVGWFSLSRRQRRLLVAERRREARPVEPRRAARLARVVAGELE